jgi:hypothetical protein
MPEFMETRYEKDSSIVYREIAGEAVLVPVRRNLADMESIYTLDEVGAFIWDLVDGQRTMGDVRDRVLDEYNVEPEVLDSDLFEFVEQLKSIGALRVM